MLLDSVLCNLVSVASVKVFVEVHGSLSFTARIQRMAFLARLRLPLSSRKHSHTHSMYIRGLHLFHLLYERPTRLLRSLEELQHMFMTNIIEDDPMEASPDMDRKTLIHDPEDGSLHVAPNSDAV